MSYSSALGRFLERDPIGYSEDGMNLYQANRGNPVNGVDPLGLFRINIGPINIHLHPIGGDAKLRPRPDLTSHIRNFGRILHAHWKFGPTHVVLDPRLWAQTNVVKCGRPLGGVGAGMVTAGAAAALITYLAMKNIEVRYEIVALEGDLQLDQANQRSIRDYWHRRMGKWAENFIDGIAECDSECCDSTKTKRCRDNFVQSIKNTASTIAIAFYSQNRGSGQRYERPSNPDQMAAAIYQLGGAAFSAYDECVKDACGS